MTSRPPRSARSPSPLPPSTGALGEALAASHLERRGLRLLARNWRCPEGELDLVARAAGTLVFVEVKTRVRRDPGDDSDPLEAIDRRKQARLRRLAARWLQAERPVGVRELRFDAIAVLLDRERRLLALDHREAAW